MRSQLIPSVLLIFAAVLIVACHSATGTKAVQPGTTGVVGKAIGGSGCDTTVVNQEFGFDALAFEVFKADTNKIKGLFLDRAVLKMQKQTSEDGTPYYRHLFTDGTNTITLYRNPKEGFYIEDADIKNDRVRLNKKISIGMKEDELLKLLKVANISCDTITVEDEESTFESVYIFKDARLREIKMGQIVE